MEWWRPCRQPTGQRRDMRDTALQLLQKALADPALDFRAGQWERIEGILQRIWAVGFEPTIFGTQG